MNGKDKTNINEYCTLQNSKNGPLTGVVSETFEFVSKPSLKKDQ